MRKILLSVLATTFVFATAAAWGQTSPLGPFGQAPAQYGQRFPSVTNPQQMGFTGERPATMMSPNANPVCNTVGRNDSTVLTQSGVSGGAAGAGHQGP